MSIRPLFVPLTALLSGALMPFAYAPYGWYLLSLLSLLVLFFLWRDASPRQAGWSGFLFGLSMFGYGVSWIFVSIHEYGFVPLPLALLLTILFVSVMAVFPAMAGYLFAVLRDRRPASSFLMMLLVAAIWVLFEWLRAWFMSGFPWLHIGYAYIDTPLAAYAPVLGVYGLSWGVAMTAAILAGVFTAGHVAGSLSHYRPLVVIMLIWTGGVLLDKVSWHYPSGEPLTVSLVQGNIPQELKWLPSMREPTRALYEELTWQHSDSDLVIWPETALPFYSFEIEHYLADLQRRASREDMAILLGLVHQQRGGHEYFNSMVGLGAGQDLNQNQGQLQMYHKNHLVPFTEYLPVKWLFSALVEFLGVPMSDFTSGGDQQRPMQLAGQRIGVSICFEGAFGEEVIRMLPEATILVNVSNDAWFGRSIAPAQNLQMARMRALEVGRPLLRATNTGLTALITAEGELQAIAPQFEEAVLTGMVQPQQGVTPYVRLGNAPAVLLSLLVIVLVLIRGRVRA